MELSRFLSSFLVGWLLGLNGSVSQVLTHNKLASPSTIGVDGLAILVCLSIFFSNQIIAGQFSSFAALILFTCVCVAFLLLIIFRKINDLFLNNSNQKGQKLVLIGLSFNLLISGFFYLFYYLSMVANVRYPSDMFFGDFRSHTWIKVLILLFITAIYSIITARYRRHWSGYSLGADIYRMLYGPSFFFVLNLCMILLSTIYTTYFFGVFSLLGLLFPYVFRSFFKTSKIQNELKWIGFFSGAALCLTDLICYSFPVSSSEIPAGLVIAILGPFFLIFKIIENTKITQ